MMTRTILMLALLLASFPAQARGHAAIKFRVVCWGPYCAIVTDEDYRRYLEATRH